MIVRKRAKKWLQRDLHPLTPRPILADTGHIILGSCDMVMFVVTTASVFVLLAIVLWVIGYVWEAGYYIVQAGLVLIRDIIYGIAPLPNAVYNTAIWMNENLGWMGVHFDMSGWGLWGTAYRQNPLPTEWGPNIKTFDEYLISACVGYDNAAYIAVSLARIVAMPTICPALTYLEGNAFFGAALYNATRTFIPEAAPSPTPCTMDAVDVFCTQLGLGFFLVQMPFVLGILWIFFGLLINGVLWHAIMLVVHVIALPIALVRFLHDAATHIECYEAMHIAALVFPHTGPGRPPHVLPDVHFLQHTSAPVPAPANEWDPLPSIPVPAPTGK